MKRIFLTVMLLSICLLSFSQLLTEKLATDTDTDRGIVYLLPKTILQVEVDTKCVQETPGLYFQYADRFLGIKDFIQNESNRYEITGFRLTTKTIPDPEQAYLISTGKKGKNITISLTPEGYLKSINGTGENVMHPISVSAETVAKISPKAWETASSSIFTKDMQLANSTATSKAIAPPKQPFFLYLAYNAPHVPLDAKDRKLYENSGLPVVDQSYAALVSHMDENIGRVLQTLKKLGLDKNTIVVFASDNGGATAAEVKELKLNGNLRGFKGELWEGGIRVPMMVRWPGHIKPGTVSNQSCYFPDFFPTFAKLAGVRNLEESVRGLLRQKLETDYYALTKASVTDGVDLMPALKGKKLPQRMLYWEQFPRTGLSQAVRFGDWKAVRMDLKKPWMLYNLKLDPSETTDVAAKNPKVLAQINTYIATARRDSECWPVD